MRTDSLAFRLIAAASLWALVALLAAGFIITSLYRDSVERNFDERLNVYLKTLVGALAAQNPANLADPGNLGDQRFELPYSGWYWQVRRAGGGAVMLTSRSLFNDTLDAAKVNDPREIEGAVGGALVGPDNQSLRILSRTVELGQGNSYEVLVTGNAGDMADDIARFR
ncbi:MAG: histidine kinase, partial [Rhizobiales bacterium]|nr:histidine kinase [Hyphomicrobiales bacterium]